MIKSRLEDLGAEVVEDLLILAANKDEFLALELGLGNKVSSVWAEVEKADAAEKQWLHQQAEIKVQQRKAEEEERRVTNTLPLYQLPTEFSLPFAAPTT